MKPMKKLMTLALLVMMVATAAISFAEATGSAAVVGSQTYTLEQMLTYAIQDEYAARATYVAIQKAFGEQRPFANIDGAESTHVAELTVLFNTYGLTVPADTATAAAPATVAEAYASRASYGAPDWQVQAWVSTYTAIAAGELATVTDDVPLLTGRPGTTLVELLRRNGSAY